MIRIASQPKSAASTWHEVLLRLLPTIRRHASVSFRYLAPEAREEAIQGVICNACSAVARLAELGKLDLAYAGPLARFGVSQVRDGRMTGGRLNCRDVLSPYCRRLKGVTVERLDQYIAEEDCWLEAVVEDPHTPVFDQVQFRVDFPGWLSSLSRRNRRIAEVLALGHTTGAVAKRFRVSPGRVSQLRAELAESWHQFVGDDPANAA